MEDKSIKLFKELIGKAMHKAVNINFFGTEYKKAPDHISITQKEFTKQKIGVKENGRPLHEITSDGGVLIDVYIGDKRGFGRGSVAVEGIGRDESSIRRKIEPNLEEAIKKALLNYCEKTVASSFDDANPFYILSKEQPVESIDSIPRRDKNIIHEKKARDIEQQLKALWDLFCANKEIVKKAEMMIRSTDLVRRFVNSEGTAIRSHNFRSYYRVTLDVLTDDLRLIECMDTPYYAMTPEKIKNYNYVNNKRIHSLIEHIKVLSKTRPLIQSSAGTVKCPAYFGPRAFANYIHEPLAHPKEGNQSIGEQVLPSFITVIDDPTYRFGHGYINYDDEGVKSKKTVLVQNGKRNDVLLDRNTAGKLGRTSNGHARSEYVLNRNEETGRSYVGIPEPRVTNLITRTSNGVSEQKLFKEFLRYLIKSKSEYGAMVRGGVASIEDTRDFDLQAFSIHKVYPDGRMGKTELTSGARVAEDPSSLLKILLCSNTYAKCPSNCGADSGTVPDSSIGPAAIIKEVTFKEMPERRLKKRPV